MYLRLEGLVLRETEYADSDKLLTVLTREHGKMTLRARGVRRRNSLIRSACQLLTYSEFTIFEYRGFSAINEAEPKEMFLELRADLERLSLASYFAQVAEVVSQEDSPNGQLLSLVLNSMYALGKLCRPQTLVKSAFEIRTACIAGYAPMLDGCVICGNSQPDRFNVSHGVLQCERCRSEELGGLRLPVGPGSLAALRYLVGCDASRLFSFSLSGRAEKELNDLTETYLLSQLERGFYTLDFYKSLLLPDSGFSAD